MVTSVRPPAAARADDAPAATGEAPPAEQQTVIVDGADIEGWDQEKFWTYLACGTAIVVTTSGAGIVAVVVACGRAATLYWNR
jgi:hypothetical protein